MADRPDGKIFPSFLSLLKMHLIQGIGFFIMCFIFLSAFLLPPRKEHLFYDVWKFDYFLKFFNQPSSGGVLGSMTYSSNPNKKPVFLLGTFVWMKFRSLPKPKELKF